MAKNHEISAYFSTKAIFALLYVTHRHNFEISKCAGFQTKDAIELESCKQGKIWNLLSLIRIKPLVAV